jgi:hypothetical protein
MSNSNTQILIDYWQARRVGAAAPSRASIDPMDFPRLLPQAFMLGRRAPGEYAFRLVGGFVAALHDRDLRGSDFTHLWAQNARLPIKTALELARRQVEPVRIAVDVQAGVHTLPMDMVLLPLTNAEGVADRFLGLYQPNAPIARLRGLPADRLAIVTLGEQTAEDAEQPRIRLVSVAGERVR